MKPYVISISAVSGGGKTAITNALTHSLNKAVAFYFDEYEYSKQPDDIGEWANGGSRPDAWDLSLIENDIYAAMQTDDCDYIVIDYPFGKNSEYNIGNIIDIAFFIDTPLDIALARRIVRDFKNSTAANIIDELTNYPSIRKYYVYDEKSRKQYDYFLDGCRPVNDIVIEIKEKIESTIDK